MNLKLQKRLAKAVLGVGERRVWFDPEKMAEIKEAITRGDIRSLVSKRYIKVKPKGGITKRKKGKKGPGRRKGKKGAREGKKRKWISKIRAIRKLLNQMRRNKTVDAKTYRRLYRLSKGNFFRDRSHVKLYVTKLREDKGELKKKEVKKVGKRTNIQSKVQKTQKE